MSAVNVGSEMEQRLHDRIAQISREVPGSIGDILKFSLVNCQTETGDFELSCWTEPWMRNFAGTLHGGLCATILDQAMGFVSYCLKDGKGAAPTVQLEVDFLRPLIPGEEVLVKVHVVSETKTLMNLTAEAVLASHPDKICLSGSGIYYFKSAAKVEE